METPNFKRNLRMYIARWAIVYQKLILMGYFVDWRGEICVIEYMGIRFCVIKEFGHSYHLVDRQILHFMKKIEDDVERTVINTMNKMKYQNV